MKVILLTSLFLAGESILYNYHYSLHPKYSVSLALPTTEVKPDTEERDGWCVEPEDCVGMELVRIINNLLIINYKQLILTAL